MPRLNPLDVQDSLNASEVDRDALDEEDERLRHGGDAWHFLRGVWSAGPNGLDHDNFTCDLTLRLNGDFESTVQRLATVGWIAQRLNVGPAPGEALPDWARGRWTADPAARTVFHSNAERDIGLRISGDMLARRRAQALLGLARQLNGETLPADGSL